MTSWFKKYNTLILSAGLFLAALAIDHLFSFPHSRYVYIALYGCSYLPVGLPVWKKAFESIKNGTVFSEFLLMGIATIGAFAIGEFAEGVAVMLFYMTGEHMQHGAVHRARSSIKALIDQQPDVATVERNSYTVEVSPSEVAVGEIIQVKPGEKVPLDGTLLTDRAAFNTAALTGESKPMSRKAGDEIWAGSINQEMPVRIKVSSDYEDTKLSNILTLVQEAAKRKAPTQRFITRFARVYTPIVVWLAAGLTFLPFLFVDNYVFQEWFYRALIFLVVSCPCGLVISVPLGYFGGIGAASGNGILLKGSDFLDQLRKIDTLFLDKTGTLTEGVFEVQEIQTFNGMDEATLLRLAASLEQQSTHPVARAILNRSNGQPLSSAENQKEHAGKGLSGIVDQHKLLVGNGELLEQHGIAFHQNSFREPNTRVFVAMDGQHVGTISISDKIKSDSPEAIAKLREQGIQKLAMLSGDSQEVADFVARKIGLDKAFGNLLPDEKYHHIEQALKTGGTVGFVGDGVNDAPVITLADVGIAMGGIGSDATVETADVVIQSDQPSKIPVAIDIANFTHRIVWQNIIFALGIKVGVMVLAAMGWASMWAAIFADVGVALLAIANAIRIQSRFSEQDVGLTQSLQPTASEPEEPACACCE